LTGQALSDEAETTALAGTGTSAGFLIRTKQTSNTTEKMGLEVLFCSISHPIWSLEFEKRLVKPAVHQDKFSAESGLNRPIKQSRCRVELA
jgi:hypothetical protein